MLTWHEDGRSQVVVHGEWVWHGEGRVHHAGVRHVGVGGMVGEIGGESVGTCWGIHATIRRRQLVQRDWDRSPGRLYGCALVKTINK